MRAQVHSKLIFGRLNFVLHSIRRLNNDVWIHLHWHVRDFNKRCRNHCGQRMNSIWILLDSAGTMIHMVLGPLILILNILFVDNFPTGQFSALKIPVWIVCKWTVSIYANDFDSLNCCRMRMLLVQLRLFSWNWQVFTWNNVETLFISGAKMRSKSKSHGKNRLDVNGFGLICTNVPRFVSLILDEVRFNSIWLVLATHRPL